MDIDKKIKEAREFLKNHGYFVQNMWTVDDIIDRASLKNINLSVEQSFEIMELMGKSFNAEIGINWDTIDAAIDECFEE